MYSPLCVCVCVCVCVRARAHMRMSVKYVCEKSADSAVGKLNQCEGSMYELIINELLHV
jgi:hypothetical protein